MVGNAPFILIRALSCPAPRVMETQHKELDLGRLDSHSQRTIANPRQTAWNQRPNLLQHSNDCGQTTITSFPGRQPGAHLTSWGDRVKSRSYATASLRAWLAMPPFMLITALSCPAPRVMETQHKELDLGRLDSHPQRTIANPRQIAWNQRPNLLQH